MTEPGPDPHNTDAGNISDLLYPAARESDNRLELWAALLRRIDARRVGEIGVYRGAFAAHVLGSCPAVETYLDDRPMATSRRLE
jgi:hypothetical protein